VAAQWWEIWSPGLQCLGAVLEAGGIVLFARDWWRSNAGQEDDANESTRAAWQIAQIGRSNTGRNHGVGPNVDFDAIQRAELQERAEDQRYSRIVVENQSRERTYKVALFLIGSGISVVLLANGIAWAGAYGLFQAAK
jgi:hypothetical protein